MKNYQNFVKRLFKLVTETTYIVKLFSMNLYELLPLKGVDIQYTRTAFR